MQLERKSPATGERGRASGIATGKPRHLKFTPIDTLLHALESATGRSARRAGKGWRSRCPSCGGKSEKVSIAEAENGAVLLHCFGGCKASEVVQAVGLALGDLFPERIAPTTPEERRQARQWAQEARWKAALEVLAVEVSVIFLAGRQLATWQPLSDEDDKRLALAVQRVRDSREVLNGRS